MRIFFVVIISFFTNCSFFAVPEREFAFLNFILGNSSTSTAPSVIATNAIVGEEKFAINRELYAIFNKEIKIVGEPALDLKSGNIKIPGKSSVEGNTLIFKPDNLLPKNAKLKANISRTTISDLQGTLMESDFSFPFETGVSEDVTPPLVTSIFPFLGSENVSINSGVYIQFSEAMDNRTLTTSNIQFQFNGVEVSSKFHYSGNVLQIIPNSNLEKISKYTISISGVKDSAGNVLEKTYSSNFTTGGEVDKTPPMASAIFPEDNSTNVPITQKGILIVFSEILDSASINSENIQISTSGNKTSGAFNRLANTIVFYPTDGFLNSAEYKVRLTQNLKDLAGNPLDKEYTYTFTTVSDYIPSGTSPAPTFTMSSTPFNLTNGQTNVSTNTDIKFYFPEVIDPSGANGNNLILEDGSGNKIKATYRFENNYLTVVLDPDVELSSFTTYTVKVIAGLKSLSGKSLASDYNLSFTTGAGSITTETYPWGTFTDMFNGTIKFEGVAGTFGGFSYSAQTLYFMKCSQGQTWNSGSNSCSGTPTPYQYCNNGDNSCNGGINTGILDGGGSSDLFTSCDTLNFAGQTDWRVPTKSELKTLIHCTDKTMPNDNSTCSSYTSPTISFLFPNTYTSNGYFTSNSASSSTLWYVRFSDGRATTGFKTFFGTRARCVRTGP